MEPVCNTARVLSKLCYSLSGISAACIFFNRLFPCDPLDIPVPDRIFSIWDCRKEETLQISDAGTNQGDRLDRKTLFSYLFTASAGFLCSIDNPVWQKPIKSCYGAAISVILKDEM